MEPNNPDLSSQRFWRRSHPTGRASVVGAVLGIVAIALAVVAAVPVAMNWPDSWPGALVVVALASFGLALIRRHMSRHRTGQVHADSSGRS